MSIVSFLLCFLPALWADDPHDDPTHDEPKTSMMNFQETDASLSIGGESDGDQSRYFLSGRFLLTKAESPFLWNVSLEVFVPLKDMEELSPRSINASVGGKWWFSGNGKKTKEEIEEDQGITTRGFLGLNGFVIEEVQRPAYVYDDQEKKTATNTKRNDVDVSLPPCISNGQTLRGTLIGAVTQLGFNMIELSEVNNKIGYQSTLTGGFTFGIGVGQLYLEDQTIGLNQNQFGLVMQLGYDMRIFNSTSGLRAMVTSHLPFDDKGGSIAGLVDGTIDFGLLRFSAGASILASDLKNSQVNADAMKVKYVDLYRLFLSIGIRIL